MKLADDLTCAELVELVTDYLERTLPAPEAERFEQHLVLCPGCTAHFGQMRTTIRVTGRVREEDLGPDLTQSLLTAFRGWRGERER